MASARAGAGAAGAAAGAPPAEAVPCPKAGGAHSRTASQALTLDRMASMSPSTPPSCDWLPDQGSIADSDAWGAGDGSQLLRVASCKRRNIEAMLKVRLAWRTPP